MWAQKPLFLPSSGLFYDSVILIKEPDLFLINEIQKDFFSSSESEFLYFIISRYTNFKNPGDMLFRDAFFVWIYILSIFNGETLNLDSLCQKCKENNTVKISLGNSKIIYLNKNSNKNLKIEVDDFIFEYERRKLKHNIQTGIKEIDIRDQDLLVKTIQIYFEPQIINIKKQNENISIENIEEIFNIIGYKKILKIFNEIKNEDFGIEDKYFYYCNNCNFKNISNFGDSFSSSLLNVKKEKRNSNFFEEIVKLTSFKMLSLSELLSIPYSQWETVSNAIIKVQKEKSGVKNFVEEFVGE